MKNSNEPLDYCRVKKIFDKGFGFLKSLHYQEPVFFHFNNVKDPAAKEKLEKMKRGEVYFYFTSILFKGRRRVYKIWLDISDVDRNLIPDFANRVTEEFISGDNNPFEVAYVLKQLRENNFLNKDNFERILYSGKMIKTPSLLKSMIREDESEKLEIISPLIEELESKKIDSAAWIEKVKNEFSD